MKKNTRFNKLHLKHFSIIEDATGEIFKPENANLLQAKQAPGLTINSKRYFILTNKDSDVCSTEASIIILWGY